ncbi:unannotated protein [freshwater metagenome]|uniref:Unannotated protein n=1 Tax=freshwater metagenome TaxID=449393 RepID=A0A6J6AV65_9ZZZZ
MLTMRKRLSALIAIVFASISLGLAPAYAVDERVIDVVAVNWNGSASAIGKPQSIAGVINTEVNADWKKFTTMVGATKDRTISFKAGKVLDTPITLLSRMSCTGYAASDFMTSIRPEAYKRLGIADYSNRYLVVYAPKAGCVWSGRAELGGPKSTSGTLILHDSESSFVITHELGHALGLGHSNFLRCDNSAFDGAWSSTCKAVEYGGTIDVMGNVETSSPLSTYHQWRMGLMDDSQIKQVWQSENVTLSPSDFANGIKAVFIRDGKAAYWIEYRRKTDGVQYKPGLAIYRIDPPPISSIVSPNPEDSTGSEFGSLLGTDVWMLNLDTYKYTTSSSVSGSMTATTATTYSGNVSFSAVASETNAVVTITKKADVTPPPTPVLVPVAQWQSPNMVIIAPGNEDADTAITGFEGQIDGVVRTLKASDVEGWAPTYLSPFVAPKTVYLRDLPEGSYSFALRSIDVVGNKSEWSKPVKTVIDRVYPVVTNNFVVSAANTKESTVVWKGATDAGAGICQANVLDEDGLVIQSTSAKNAPAFILKSGESLTGIAQVFDCAGNGQSGELSITNSFIAASKSSRTGKWTSATTPFGAGSLKCVGKCTASISTSGKFHVLLGAGNATIEIGGKKVASVSQGTANSVFNSNTIDAGATKKVVRISGSNFVLVGLSAITTTLGALKGIDRAPAINDPSLSDDKQAKLAQLGFRADDFSQEWTVLPMDGGTKLDDPSLDLCSGTFPSERDRVQRRQIAATKEGSTFTFLSSEVVKYSSAAAASAAQKELVKVLAQCQLDKGYKNAAGALVPYEFKTLKNIPAGVVSESNRVFVYAVIDSGEDARTLLGFYQFNGDTFTGLYVMNSNGFSDAQVAKWLNVAVTMANRLQQK